MHLPAWRLELHRAGLELHSWRVALDVSRPEEGLALTELRGQEPGRRGQSDAPDGPTRAQQHVLGVELADRDADQSPLTDCYVRGPDLVATYTIPTLATRVQVYWRAASDALDSGAAEAIDLQVSVQTDMLDASPRVSTRSVLASDRVERLLDARTPTLGGVAMGDAAPQTLVPDASPACLLFPLRGGEFVYVEMIHPADFRQCRLSRRDDRVVVEHCLFAETDLEKGVIMRARVRGMLVRSAAAERIVAEAYERFVAASPPLTT